MEGGVTIQQRMNEYNQTFIDLLWGNKLKLAIFTGITIMGYMSIPRIHELQTTMEQKSDHGKKHLTLKDLQERGNIFDVVLDVRSQEEYEKGHVKGAIQVDYKEIIGENGAKELNAKGVHPNQYTLVYCKSGKRASIAMKHMIQNYHYDPNNLYMTSESFESIQQAIA